MMTSWLHIPWNESGVAQLSSSSKVSPTAPRKFHEETKPKNRFWPLPVSPPPISQEKIELWFYLMQTWWHDLPIKRKHFLKNLAFPFMLQKIPFNFTLLTNGVGVTLFSLSSQRIENMQLKWIYDSILILIEVLTPCVSLSSFAI